MIGSDRTRSASRAIALITAEIAPPADSSPTPPGASSQSMKVVITSGASAIPSSG